MPQVFLATSRALLIVLRIHSDRKFRPDAKPRMHHPGTGAIGLITIFPAQGSILQAMRIMGGKPQARPSVWCYSDRYILPRKLARKPYIINPPGTIRRHKLCPAKPFRVDQNTGKPLRYIGEFWRCSHSAKAGN